MQESWDALCVELKIRRFVSHQIRHTCATQLLRQNVNPLTIAKHMDHHSLATIQTYAEVGLDERHLMLEVLDLRTGQRPAQLSDEDLARAEASAFAAYEALRIESLHRAVRELLEVSA